MDAIDQDALYAMRQRGGKWAAYMNMAMDSSNAGHLQFLQYGEGRTFKEPPKQYPSDTAYGMGWRYPYYGEVNLEDGVINAKDVLAPTGTSLGVTTP